MEKNTPTSNFLSKLTVFFNRRPKKMNTTLTVSKHSKLLSRRLRLHFFKLQPASFFLHRQLYSEPEPEPQSPAPPQDDESEISQAVQILLETPHHEWSSSQPLQSLLFSSPPPPHFLLKVTRSLASSSQALNFVKHLQQNTPSLDTQLLSYPVQALLEQAGREPDAGSRLFELYQASKEWEIPLTVNAATLLIRYFGRLEMVDKSILVFEELDPSLKTTHVRNVLIDVLIRDGRLDYALDVLDEMLQPLSEVPPNDITGDITFYGLVKKDRKVRNLSEEDTVKLVLKFGKHGVFPKPKWLNQLITKLCKKGKINQAWDFFHELLRLRAPLEAPNFNTLLTELGRSGDVKKMNSILAEMKESNIQPDVVTLGILINQFCKLGRVDEAMKVLNKMGEGSESNGVQIEADVIIYNTLIDGLCKVGKQEEGLRLMERMKLTKGLAPNAVTYNSLINGYCKVGEIERGKQLFDQMNAEGISPNVRTLNILVHNMCRHGRINSALEFFNDMQGKGLKVNAVTYTSLITAFTDANNFGMAVHLFDQMLSSGLSADATVYYSLISGFCKAGRMDDASNILSKLKEAGYRPDLVCYNALITGFCKNNKVDKAREIIREMEEAKVKPDIVTYNTLIAHFCKAGKFELASRMMKQMIKEGCLPTVATYGALIHAYCLNGKIEDAMKLFNDMSSTSKIPPNTIIYNILIESLCKNNEVEDALHLMDDMKAKGVKPNTTTYNAMLKGLKENNLLEDAFRLMDGMIEDACDPDYITLEILTEWLSVVGEKAKLKNFLRGYKVSSTSTA